MKIMILGDGMVGRALHRHFSKNHEVIHPTRHELDLCDYHAAESYLGRHSFDWAVVAAGRVGGVMANKSMPADFGHVNGLIALNTLAAFRRSNAKVLYLASSCVYPRDCPQPMRPEHLMTGVPEPTNEMYTLAKLMGVKLCAAYRRQYKCNYISCIPANLYGPHDNFNPERSHVIPAVMRKMHAAPPSLPCHGTGEAVREFMHVDDLGNAAEILLWNYEGEEPVNVGVGVGTTVRELVETLKDVTGYAGEIVWDASKPSGQKYRVMDSSAMNAMGWRPNVQLREGLTSMYRWMLENPWCLESR